MPVQSIRGLKLLRRIGLPLLPGEHERARLRDRRSRAGAARARPSPSAEARPCAGRRATSADRATQTLPVHLGEGLPHRAPSPARGRRPADAAPLTSPEPQAREGRDEHHGPEPRGHARRPGRTPGRPSGPGVPPAARRPRRRCWQGLRRMSSSTRPPCSAPRAAADTPSPPSTPETPEPSSCARQRRTRSRVNVREETVPKNGSVPGERPARRAYRWCAPEVRADRRSRPRRRRRARPCPVRVGPVAAHQVSRLLTVEPAPPPACSRT